jgi:hypothetical protein
MPNTSYQSPERLGDVLALIQVLAIHEDTRKSEEGLEKILQEPRSSTDGWLQIAREHPEFFRTSTEHFDTRPTTPQVSLVARFSAPARTDTKRDPLDPQLLNSLHSLAIQLYDRQTGFRWSNRYQVVINAICILVGAVLSGIVAAAIAHH